MKPSPNSLFAVALVAMCCAAPLQAQASLFNDDEARRAILDLRKRIDDVNTRLESKTDKSTNLDLAGQNEQLRQELAKLRGQNEVLPNALSNELKRQKDFYADLDARLRMLEPQPMNIDGKEVS